MSRTAARSTLAAAPVNAEDEREVIDLADPVGDLAEAWLAERLPLPVAAAVTARSCQVAGCRSMPFVRLRTVDGDRNLCLRHFQSVKSRAHHAGASRGPVNTGGEA